MNLQNSQQVTFHLRKLIKTEKQLRAIEYTLSETRREALGRFSGLVEISAFGEITVPYFDKYCSKENLNDWLTRPSLSEKIAYAMRDYDAPFCKQEVTTFCNFFEIDPGPMLKEASTDWAYESWQSDEIRANNF